MNSSKKNNIDISIVIVNYNGYDLLKNCLVTFYRFASGYTFEIIIVDNNSTDCDIYEMTNEFKGVVIIKNKMNLGYSRANNIGLKLAKGKYVLFLNNDVFFTENSIKKVFDFSEKQYEKAFVGCKLLNPDGSWQASTAKFPSGLNFITSSFFLYLIFPSAPYLNKYYLQKKDVKVAIEVDYILGAFLFGAREVFFELNGFDERFFFYAEDIDLCFRLKLIGGKTIFYPETSVVHIGGASVESNQWFKFNNKTISELQFFQKHKKGIEFLIGILSNYIGNLLRIPIAFFFGLIRFDKQLLIRSYFHLKLLFVYPKNLFKE